MTTATKPLPDHGERRRYLRGCRCSECSNAHYRYMSRYRLDRERGQHRRVDSAPAAAHVRTLLNAGWNQRQIADAAQCAHRVIADLAAKRQATTLPRISTRILAITPHPVPAPAQYADATGTIRRVCALIAMGYPINHLAAAIGIWPANLGRIARGELTQVSVPTAKATAAAYRELSRRPGPSQAARNRAKREGWHGPLAWDSDTIDDPSAQPDTEGEGTDQARKRDSLRPEEIRHLAGFQLSAHSIALQVGLPVKDVEGRLAKIHAERDRKQVAA